MHPLLIFWIWFVRKLLECKRRTFLRNHRRVVDLSIAFIILLIVGVSQVMFNSNENYGSPAAWRWYLVSERELAVYAAYLDYQDDPSSAVQVVVIAVLNITEKRPLYCHFITDSTRQKLVPSVGPIQYQELGLIDYPQVGKVKFLKCPITGMRAKPIAVRISGHRDALQSDDAQPWISVYSSAEEKLKTAWCVGPLYDNYDEVQILVEQLEWAKMQGMDRVIVYVDSVDHRVMTVLSYYEKEGLVQLIDWNIARLVNRNVYYLGQIALLNDCVYRNRHRADYVFLNDIDERVIVPRQLFIMKTVDSMLNESTTAAITMRSAFFLRAPNGSKLLMHSQLISSFYKHFVRSKMIVKPNYVQAVDIHDILRMQYGYERVLASERQLLIAHFRHETFDINYTHDTSFSLPAEYVDRMAPIVSEKMKLFLNENTYIVP